MGMTSEPNLISVSIEPVIDDGPIYYKVIIWNVELKADGTRSKDIRDIYHANTAQRAADLLASFLRA